MGSSWQGNSRTSVRAWLTATAPRGSSTSVAMAVIPCLGGRGTEDLRAARRGRIASGSREQEGLRSHPRHSPSRPEVLWGGRRHGGSYRDLRGWNGGRTTWRVSRQGWI